MLYANIKTITYLYITITYVCKRIYQAYTYKMLNFYSNRNM